MSVQLLTVTADEGEQRLDRWFKRRFPHLTQGAEFSLAVRILGGEEALPQRFLLGFELKARR